MNRDVALIIVGEFGSCPKISVKDWLSSSLAHIGESPEPGTTPREKVVAILFTSTLRKREESVFALVWRTECGLIREVR